MALEVVGSTPITHPTKYKLPAQGNTYHGTVFWDVAKLVRHRILIPAFGGSSPSSPAKNRQGSTESCRFYLASLGVEINPRFYRGRIKKLQQKKNLCDIIVNGLATALLKIYHGGF